MGTRTTYVTGPATITFNGVDYWSEGDIAVTEGFETIPINVAAFGKVDERAKERIVKLSWTPAGQLTAATLGAYWPYVLGSYHIGDDIFPQTDIPVTVTGLDGTQRIYAAGAITKMPAMNIGAIKNLWGPMEMTCLGTGDSAWSGATSLKSVPTTGQTFPTTLNVLTLIRQSSSGAWGARSAPWNAIRTVDGFTVDPVMQFFNKEIDQYGIAQMGIQGIEVTLKFKPVSQTAAGGAQISETDIQSKVGYQNTGAARGMSLAAIGDNFVITTDLAPGHSPIGHLVVTVKNAFIKDYQMAYGFQPPRIGEVTMMAARDLTSPGGYLTDYLYAALS